MPKTYEAAPVEVYQISESLLLTERFFDLKQLQIRIGIRCIRAVESESGGKPEPPIVKNGNPVAAQTSLVSEKDRVFNNNDVIIDLDYDFWDTLKDRQKQALMAHELSHIVVQRDKDGSVKIANDTRPILKLIPDDWQITGFRHIVEEYGEDAVELQSLWNVWDGLKFPDSKKKESATPE